MTLTPDQNSGASPTQNLTPPLPAPPAIAIVTGHPRELVDLTKSLLRNDTLRGALIAIAPDATTELTVKFTRTKEISLTATPRGVSIEIPNSTKLPAAREALSRAITREFTLTALTTTARHRVVPTDPQPLLLDLVEAATHQRPGNAKELAKALFHILQPTLRDLPTLASECAKRVGRIAALRVTNLANTTKSIDEVIDQLARFRALSWLSQDHELLEGFDATGAKAVETMQMSLLEEWDNAFKGLDLNRANATMGLCSYLRKALEDSGFSSAPPAWLPMERETLAPRTLEQRAALLQRGVGGTNITKRRHSFVIDALAQMPEMITGLASTEQFEREIRGWTPPERNVTHSIHADLLDTMPEAVRALPTLKSIPSTFPAPLKRFVECVGRLKHHGGVEGLETHCVIIAPGAWLERMKDAKPIEGGTLHRELQSNAHANIREYLNLVELAATWEHRSLDSRVKVIHHFYDRTALTLARGIWSSVAEATYMIHTVLTGAHTHDEISVKLSSERLKELAEAAEALGPIVPSPEVSRALQEAARITIPTLISAKRALEINALPWPEILTEMDHLSDTFDESPLGTLLRDFTTDLRAAVANRVSQEIGAVDQRVSAAFDSGSVDTFTESANSAVELARRLRSDDPNRERLLVLVDAWTLKYINLAQAAIEHDLSLGERDLRASPDQTEPRDRAIETLDFFIDEISPLRELLVKHQGTIPAARLNHLHMTVSGVFQRYPLVGSAYVEELLKKVTNESRDETTAKRASLIRVIPGVPNKLSAAGKSAVLALRKVGTLD